MCSTLNSTSTDHNVNDVSIITYNMHGFNQGILQLKLLCNINKTSVVMVQEHWCNNDSLVQFDYFDKDYRFYGISAMDASTNDGILRGRPWGGVGTLVSRSLPGIVKCIACTDRYVIVAVGNLLLVNVYLPYCRNALDRDQLCSILECLTADIGDCSYLQYTQSWVVI